MRRAAKITLQIAVSAAVIAYLLWQIDVGKTLGLIGSSNPVYLVVALALFLVTVAGMAWRWGALLASKGIHEPFGWLVKSYFVGIAGGQVLPTAIGGDAIRIYDHSRRRPESKGENAGAILMERAIGSAGTLILVAVGLVLAVGRYDNIALLVWLELAFVAAMVAFAALLFWPRADAWLAARGGGRIVRGFQSLWSAMHGYRHQRRTLVVVLAATVVFQFVRVLAIWLCGLAVGIHLSPLPYVVLGPLLFLVMMVPFTINGLGVREAFFVAFLARFHVGADAAFATGFLFYAVTIATALPGGAVLLWRSYSAARGTDAPAAVNVGRSSRSA